MEVKLVKCLIIRNDLAEAALEIRNKGLFLAIAHLKMAFVSLHNLNDFEKTLRSLYSENRELSPCFYQIDKAVQFFSYLRNRFAAHLVDELVLKALEWKPEMALSFKRDHNPNLVLLYNFFILETAINSYVDDTDSHKFFATETNLSIHEDEKRFCDALLSALDGGVIFLRKAEEIIKTQVSVPENNFDTWRKAGLTKFNFLSKKNR